MTGDERTDLPDVLGGGDPPEGSVAARRLLELDGGAGIALGDLVTGSCAPVAITLDSPTTATMLLYPRVGESPGDVTPAQITRLDGITGVSDQATSGDMVRAELEIESPSVPTDIFQRLGLPGTQIC